jgi:hypothetical protein
MCDALISYEDIEKGGAFMSKKKKGIKKETKEKYEAPLIEKVTVTSSYRMACCAEYSGSGGAASPGCY